MDEFHMRDKDRNSMDARGFTLLELLTVMAIMVIMATMAVMGHFAISRGLAAKSAVQHLTQLINFARQSAIMQGKRVYVIFNQDASGAWYSICRQEGVITDRQGPEFYDEYADFSTLSTGLVVYNLQTGMTGGVYQMGTGEPIPGVTNTFITVSPQNLVEGQAYGWDILPRTYLPRGYRWGDGTITRGGGGTPDSIIFLPEGVMPDGSGNVVIEVVETMTAPRGTRITVKYPVGAIVETTF